MFQRRSGIHSDRRTRNRNAPQTRDRELKKAQPGTQQGVSVMSTPTGRPGNPTDPFVHGSRDTYERADPGHRAVESDGDPTRSPYAPTRARERASAERSLEEKRQKRRALPSMPKNTTLSGMNRTSIPHFNLLIRTASDPPPRAAMPASRLSSGLKPPFAGFSGRKRLRGSLALHSYHPCPGLLRPSPEAVVTARC